MIDHIGLGNSQSVSYNAKKQTEKSVGKLRIAVVKSENARKNTSLGTVMSFSKILSAISQKKLTQ